MLFNKLKVKKIICHILNRYSINNYLFCFRTSIKTGIARVPTSSLYFLLNDLISFNESRLSSISNEDCTRSHKRSI